MARKKKLQAEDESGFSEIAKRFKAHPFIFGGTVLLLAFIIVAFVFAPTMPKLQKDEENPVFGYYAGKPITHNSYFNNMLWEAARMADFDLQSNYSMNPTAANQVWYQAFVRTMMRIAILDEMNNSGYRPPSGEIDRLVAANPEFQEEGKFSFVKYNAYDKNRLNSLWQMTAEDYTTGKYVNDLMGLKTSSAEKKFIGAMAYPERSFELVSMSREMYPESEVTAFAAANRNLFNTVHLSRITLSSEKDAKKLLESVQSGITAFEDAAKNHSTDIDKEKGGDMGRRMAYELFTELPEEADRNAVASLKKGEYSDLLKGTGDSWVFFRAEETPYGTDFLAEENLTKIRSYMERFEGGRIENWLVVLMEELLAGAKLQNKNLSEYIEELRTGENQNLPSRFQALEGVLLDTFGPVSLNYGNMGGSQTERGLMLFSNTLNTVSNPELAEAASNEVFWQNAFFTPLNMPSAPFTLGSSIAVLTAVEENEGDDTSIEYTANFYTWGWMYNAIGMDINSAFTESDKFENNYYSVFMPMLFGASGGNER